MVFLLCMTQNVLFGQSNAQILRSIPQESAYVHFNESTLFTGEKLLYKFYGLDNSTKKPTKISKIGYVSLIDNNGAVVFSHKLWLDSGSGEGDFFLPVALSTGTYKLLGYTEWMRNFGRETFFQADVYIINPYKTIPEAYLEEPTDSIQDNSPREHKSANTISRSNSSPFVNVIVDKTAVGKRERVAITIERTSNSATGGSYSLSIRKKDSVSFGTPMSSEAFLMDRNKSVTNRSATTNLHVPEIRGEVISGIVLEKGTDMPVENQRISLSLPGEAFLFKVATSDDKGRFSFILDRKYSNTVAAVQLMSDAVDKYEVKLDAKEGDHSDLAFPGFTIPRAMENPILQRSVHNQIENAYGEVRMDSVIPVEQITPFYRDLPIVYDLDAYTRFNTLEETIVEVTDHLSIKTLNNGSRVFEVRPNVGLPNDKLFAAVFVDGLFVKDHEDIIGYNAKRVKSINFSRENVLIGSQMFQGVLSLKTIKGDFFNEFYSPDLMNIELFRPEERKHYFKQMYVGDHDRSRVPDYRYQLLWLPKVDLLGREQEVVFYTSDVTGTYELVLEGFTENGNPVSIKRNLEVVE